MTMTPTSLADGFTVNIALAMVGLAAQSKAKIAAMFAEEWNALSEEERAKVTTAARRCGVTLKVHS